MGGRLFRGLGVTIRWKCSSGDNPLERVFDLAIRDLNLRPPAPEINALALVQLVGTRKSYLSNFVAVR